MPFCEDTGTTCPVEPERIYCPFIDAPCPHKMHLDDCIQNPCPEVNK